MELLTPLPVGPRIAPNRLLFGPHETNLADGRNFSERHTAYYQERAIGGCGVIVVEEASVHESDWPYERCPSAASAGPGWAAIATACKPFGSLVLAALGHSGGQGTSAFHQRPLWAPSDEPEVNTREVPKIMEPDDITDVIDGFGAAAATAATVDLDGVEVNAGQHSLLRQFLSGLTNRRDDEYGQDRLLLLRQVLTEVRRCLGPDRVLGLRLSCDEMAPWAGITPEQAADLARQVAPLIDYLVVVRGSIFTVSETRPTLHHDPGFNLDLTRDIRSAVAGVVPVFAQGSFVDWGQAEWALGDGRCDGVEMTRAQIADPSLAAKLASNDESRIRPCVLCNQMCRVRDNRNPIVSCVVNPRAGHETTDPEVDAVPDLNGANQAPLLVVGGGPAGLEAARTAIQAGREVTLVDRSSSLGGAARTAATTPAQERFRLFVEWQEAECRQLGVSIELSSEATPERIAEWPGPVIHATGGRPSDASFALSGPSLDAASALELLAADGPFPTGTVLVWDPTGGPTGVAIAEALAHRGTTVAYATPDAIAGNLLALSGDLAGSNVRLQQANVAIHRRVRLRSFDGAQAVFEQTMTAERSQIAAEFLIDASHRVPADRLWQQVGNAAGHLRAGDVVAPRTIGEAVREGRSAALATGVPAMEAQP